MLAKAIVVLQVIGVAGCAIGGLCSAGLGVYLVAETINQAADKKDKRDRTKQRIKDMANDAEAAEPTTAE